MDTQTTNQIVMIRPAAFGFNPQTAGNNTFQRKSHEEGDAISRKAQAEFDQLVALLRMEGVSVTVLQDTAEPAKPDAVFPNNWVSFHSDGTVITYPMFAELRRLERSEAMLDELKKSFRVAHHIALEDYERQDAFLEGTGSMVLDRENKIAYACISPRTDETVLRNWCDVMQYEPFTFRAVYDGKDIYHTNVMMAIGEGIAVVGLDVVEKDKQEELLRSLRQHGREVVLLTEDQLGSFAGNMLAVRNDEEEQLMVMSHTALDSLTADQIMQIEQYARIIASDIPTIESNGGGSVRCMIAENFLPGI